MRRGRLSSGASSLSPRSTHTHGQEASGRIGSLLNEPAQRLTKATHNQSSWSLRCRKCRGLKYHSQYELHAIRLLDRARKIRRRLGKPSASGGAVAPKATLHEVEY